MPSLAEMFGNVGTLAIDPVQRLLDPRFTDTLWDYEHSRTDALIPGKLHPKQLHALKADAKHRWLFWGNQVGKTTAGAVDCVLLALGRHPYLQKWEPPITGWASALSWELWEKVLLPELLTWIPQDRIIDAPEPHKHSTKRDILIRADNGKLSRITGKAAEQGADKYQSARVHFVWLDEEHPESVWNEMLPRLLRHGGITLATMTPLKGMSWVYHRYYEPWKAGRSDASKVYVSHAGLADNPSIKPEEIQSLTEELKHNPAQLQARLYGHFVRPMGLVLPYHAEKHLKAMNPQQIGELSKRGKHYAACDFGLWRFAFAHAVVDTDGSITVLSEVFSQRESMDQRARKITACLEWGGAPRGTVIVGDCANPQDIVELQLAMDRIGSPYRVAGVSAEHKIRKVGVERLENLLNRGAMSFRKGLGDGTVWYLGMNAGSHGKPVEGSRLLWEIDNWQYPKADDGKAQKDDPDDHTADGADMMAMLRYMVMSWWGEKPEAPKQKRSEDQHPGFVESGGRLRTADDSGKPQRPAYPHGPKIPQYRMPNGYRRAG